MGIQIMSAVMVLHSIFGGFAFQDRQEAVSNDLKETVKKGVEGESKSFDMSSENEKNGKDKADVEDFDIEDYVRNFFAENPVLFEIAMCESTMTHHKPDGTVLRGKVNSKDVGLMQINENYHLERATALGFDIHSLEGNMAYARYLFGKEGSRPWNASSKCWTKTDAYKELALKQ